MLLALPVLLVLKVMLVLVSPEKTAKMALQVHQDPQVLQAQSDPLVQLDQTALMARTEKLAQLAQLARMEKLASLALKVRFYDLQSLRERIKT